MTDETPGAEELARLITMLDAAIEHQPKLRYPALSIMDLMKLRAALTRLAEVERQLREAAKALKPFAEVVEYESRVQELDRDAVLSNWTTVHVNGSGSGGGIMMKADDFRIAHRAARAIARHRARQPKEQGE